jgi:hypothetical protein
MPLNEKCYYGEGKDRRRVTPEQALDIREKTGSFTGSCINDKCDSHIHVYAKDRLHAARFQHLPGNEKCPLSNPYR